MFFERCHQTLIKPYFQKAGVDEFFWTCRRYSLITCHQRSHFISSRFLHCLCARCEAGTCKLFDKMSMWPVWIRANLREKNKNKIKKHIRNAWLCSKCSKTCHARKRNCCSTLNKTGRGKGTATDQRRWRAAEIERHDKEPRKEEESAASAVTLRLLFN